MLNVGTVQATARLDMRRYSQGIKRMRTEGNRASASVGKGVEGIGTKLRSVAFIAQTVFASSLVMGARRAVREFALLEGATAKFEVVFADQAKEMEKWVDTFRQGVPLARREIIQASAAMQDLLIPMGLARQDATKMTQEWMELAGALAAFNDVNVTEVLDAMQSAVTGMSRPLRRFGIDVRETALQQTALEQGLIGAGDAMNETARQQALLIQAYAQSQDAIAGYDDQLGTTLMVEQELGATFKDTIALIGGDLDPAYKEFIRTLTGLVKTYQFLHIETKAFNDSNERFVTNIRRSIAILNPFAAAGQASAGAIGDLFDRIFDMVDIAQNARTAIPSFFDQSKMAADDFGDSVNEVNNEIEKAIRAADTFKQSVGAIKPISQIIDPSFATATRDEMQAITDIVREWGRFADEPIDFLAPVTADLLAITTAWEDMGLGDKLEDDFNQGTGAARFFSTTLGDGLTNVLSQAQSVEDALKNIIKQLASRALMTGLMALFGGGLGGVSFGRAMFGGTFHTGGIVGGTGEKTIIAKGGEGVFTPSQMKAMGSSGGGGTANIIVHIKGDTRLRANDLRYVIDEQIRQTVRLT